jgi:N-acetylglucosamine malate deacetylase 1
VVQITRRAMLERAPLLAASLGAVLPGISETQGGEEKRRLNIVVVGAHPDDPESGCGGTIALYSDIGHKVVVLYLTRGEAGIPGKSAREAAAIRTAEAERACEILKAKPVFAGQIDGNTELNPARYTEFRKILESESPDIVFTHWPVDSHRDHRAASLLAYDAWLEGGRKFDLYYFEVLQGEQTQIFHPTDYVDISPSANRKRAACFVHSSQLPATMFWPQHEQMAQFRGLECGVEVAEAFVRHSKNRETEVPKRG